MTPGGLESLPAPREESCSPVCSPSATSRVRDHPPNFSAEARFARFGSEMPFLRPSWPTLTWASFGPVTVTCQLGFYVGFGNSAISRCFVFRFDGSPVINQTMGMPSLDSLVVTPSVVPILGTRKLPLAGQKVLWLGRSSLTGSRLQSTVKALSGGGGQLSSRVPLYLCPSTLETFSAGISKVPGTRSSLLTPGHCRCGGVGGRMSSEVT